MTFEAKEVETRFEAARARLNTPSPEGNEGDDFQIRISVGVSLDRRAMEDLSVTCPAPDLEPVGDPNYVVANVFDRTEFREVEMSLNGAPSRP
jgi:hypothetical protein